MEKLEKPQTAPSAAAENVSSDRRNFMKGVVTGTVAAGLVATVGKAEAAPAQTSGRTAVAAMTFDGVQRVQLTLNPDFDITPDIIFEKLQNIFDIVGCPACGMIGILDNIRIDFAVQPLSSEPAQVAFRPLKSVCE